MSTSKFPALAFEPSLWGTLPKELLYLVFARLPLVGIGRLRVLSKEWKRNVDCRSSEFNEVCSTCGTPHLNMFVVLSGFQSEGCGHIYDVQENQWHNYGINMAMERVESWNGAYGGLLCFVSQELWEDDQSWFCYVVNPLTQQTIQLPPLLCMSNKVSNTLETTIRMVKLTMDRKTEGYKVFIVSSIRDGGGGFFAQVYDSFVKKWTIVEATQGHIIGWDYAHNGTRYSPCGFIVFNCANGAVQHFSTTNIARGLKVQLGCCVLIEDHLFVLHIEAPPSVANLFDDNAYMPPKFCIFEFHLPEKSTTWVKLRVHNCDFLNCDLLNCNLDEDFPYRYYNSHWRLLGCSGFLLVFYNHLRSSWLYNLSTCEWRTLPLLENFSFHRMMYTISWSAMA